MTVGVTIVFDNSTPICDFCPPLREAKGYTIFASAWSHQRNCFSTPRESNFYLVRGHTTLCHDWNIARFSLLPIIQSWQQKLEYSPDQFDQASKCCRPRLLWFERKKVVWTDNKQDELLTSVFVNVYTKLFIWIENWKKISEMDLIRVRLQQIFRLTKIRRRHRFKISAFILQRYRFSCTSLFLFSPRIRMGKFVRDKEGRMVAVSGSPVLEKVLDRKPRDCQQCGFTKWSKGDKLYILAGNVWVCPDCAIDKGLPPQFYHRNHYATLPIPGSVQQHFLSHGTQQGKHGQSGLGEILACMCYFWVPKRSRDALVHYIIAHHHLHVSPSLWKDLLTSRTRTSFKSKVQSWISFWSTRLLYLLVDVDLMETYKSLVRKFFTSWNDVVFWKCRSKTSPSCYEGTLSLRHDSDSSTLAEVHLEAILLRYWIYA